MSKLLTQGVPLSVRGLPPKVAIGGLPPSHIGGQVPAPAVPVAVVELRVAIKHSHQVPDAEDWHVLEAEVTRSIEPGEAWDQIGLDIAHAINAKIRAYFQTAEVQPPTVAAAHAGVKLAGGTNGRARSGHPPTQFWTFVNSNGIDGDYARGLLREHNNDFGQALQTLQAELAGRIH